MKVIVTKEDNVLDDNTKYIIISNNIIDMKKYQDYKVKPILILFDGSYVIDLDKNNVIIDNYINKLSVSKINKYAKTHRVDINLSSYNDKVYEIKLTTNNYHRRLIIPYMFKDLLKNIDTIKDNKDIYIVEKNSSIITAIDNIFEYLNIKYNFMELESICDYVNKNGYYKKGYDLCEN